MCRVDGRIDAAFDERMTIEALGYTWLYMLIPLERGMFHVICQVIERGSAVHMVGGHKLQQ